MPGKKLLVADDSVTIQKVIRLALSHEGYEIQTVSDGNDAIQQIALTRPDIVLIDVSLPGKSAFEVKRQIDQYPDLNETRFVLMSSAFEKVDETKENINFHGILTKPFDPAHLRQVLTTVLAQIGQKRLEKTALIENPLPHSTPPPLPFSEENDNWDSTPEPDLPTLPPLPPVESLQTLWGNEEILTDPLLTPPPPQFEIPPPPTPALQPDLNSASSHEAEIRKLTETTLNTLDFEDFPWSVNEPFTKPFSNLSEFDLPEPHILSDDAIPTTPPPPSSPSLQVGPSPPPFLKTENKTPAQSESEPSLMMPPLLPSAPLPNATPAPTSTGNTNPPETLISKEQIEILIRNEIQTTLEKMSQKLLPELAEKIIKEEIVRLLSNSSEK